MERRGIEAVPTSERRLRLSAILWTWLAANIGVLGVSLGSGLVGGLGLNLWQTVIAAVVGSAGAFAFVALVSLAGPLSGSPTMIASRATFGVRGAVAPAAVSWLLLIALEVVMATTSTFAIDNIMEIMGLPSGPWLTMPTAVVLVAVVAVIGYVGHPLIMWLQKWLGWVLGLLTAGLCVVVNSTIDWPVALAAPGADFPAVIAAIGVVAAGTGVSWMSTGGDYTRYLHPDEPRRGLFGATLLGAVPPVLVLVTTGTLLALGNSESTGVTLPDWLLVPYLVAAVLGLITSADLALYSSGLSLQAVGLRWPRPRVVLVSAGLVAVVTVLVVAVKSFTGDETVVSAVSAVVGLLALPLVAWVGVFGLDLILRRDVFSGDLTASGPDSAYWFRRGFHVPAVAAWLIGVGAGLLCTTVTVGTSVLYSGLLAGTWLGRSSLGWLVSGVAASAAYWVFEPLTRGPRSPGRAHAAG